MTVDRDDVVLISGTGLCSAGELAQGHPELAVLMLAAAAFVMIWVRHWTTGRP